jgi:hypothetical protein
MELSEEINNFLAVVELATLVEHNIFVFHCWVGVAVKVGSDPGHRWGLGDARGTFEFVVVVAYSKNVASLSIQA